MDWSVFHSDLPNFFHTQMEDRIEREIELEKEKRKKNDMTLSISH